MKLVLIIFLFFSSAAHAECDNLIDAVDVEKMVVGTPHGKTFLSCTTDMCLCIDGLDLEIYKVEVDGEGNKTLVIDSVKEETKEDEKDANKTKKDKSNNC